MCRRMMKFLRVTLRNDWRETSYHYRDALHQLFWKGKKQQQQHLRVFTNDTSCSTHHLSVLSSVTIER